MAKGHFLWSNSSNDWHEVTAHGICLPLFSIRTKLSSGIGEFLDLIPMIDWCQSVKLDCLQLLPLNDTGSDPSPYNPLSSCALDPAYLSLRDLSELELEPFIQLTQTPRVLRKEVKSLKMQWLYKYYQLVFKSIEKGPEYQLFLDQNTNWLIPYALFKTLKVEFEDRSWEDWPKNYQQFQISQIDSREKWIEFYCFVQFLCFKQLASVRAYATKQKIQLMGDLPHLLSRDSADVWSNPELFDLNYAAGAPPDEFNPKGQNWGFPLFNWELLRKNQFVWWKRRLQVAETFYHMYRMDHVMGFFRIWAIPLKKGAAAQYLPEDKAQWTPQGKEILEMLLESSTMIPIAEDLGTVPKEVTTTLKSLGVCGTRVIRWEREGQGQYIPFSEYEPLSMTTVSTPDTDTLELWWKKRPSESVPFSHFMHIAYHPILNEKGRLAIMRASHRTASLFHINILQEYLAFFPELVAINPEDERVNLPGTTLATNWTYRFRPFVEDLIAHKGLAQIFKEILE